MYDAVVAHCNWTGRTWIVQLTNGMAIPLGRVACVGKTDASGKILAAWHVQRHGYDGEGTGR